MFRANSELCINCPKMSSVIYPRWRYLRSFFVSNFFCFLLIPNCTFLGMKLFFIILSNAQDKEYFNIEIIFLFPHCVQLSLKMEKGGGGINEMFIHESSLLNIQSETKDCMKKCCNELQES